MAVLSPAIEATRTLPRDTLQSGFFEKKPVFSIGPRTLLGLFLIFISLPLAFWAPWGEYTANGYLSSFFLLLGTLFLVPLMSSLLKNILVKSKKTTSILSLALINLNASLQRTTSATTPLLVALALMVGILLMVHSFRNTVDRWIHDTIRADLIVVSKTWDLQGSDASLPENTVGLLERLPGVMAADGYREIQTYLKDEPINLVARNLDIHNRFSQYLFLEGESSSILLAASQGKGFLLSETLSNRFRLQKGDRIRLDTPQGLLDLPILGVFYDYSTDGGRVLMDRSLYRRYWPQDDQVSVVALYLDPEIPSEIFRKNLITAIDDQSFVTINNRELREGVMEVFDQTFAITYAMELIAVMVGLLGIFNTLLTSILERKRELGILRAIGMSQNQLVKMILTEGGLIGLTGALLGGGAGIGLSLILIQVINKQTFGWTIHFSLFHPFLFVVFGLVLLTAVIASLLPAKKAINIHIAQAVHYE
jgi:putative ABC transport system permease protein